MGDTMNHTVEMLCKLQKLGIASHDALALRRIAMTLHRWFELECGNGNNYGSWAIERDDNDLPYMIHHHWSHGLRKDTVTRTRIPDREVGARKRLAKIMSRYPELHAEVQTDPRYPSLYILPQHPTSVVTFKIPVFK